VKVYPVNVKLLSGAISPLSYSALIVSGAVHVASAAFQLNEIVYVIGVHLAMKYTLPLVSAQSHEICLFSKSNAVVSHDKDQLPENVYPVFTTLFIAIVTVDGTDHVIFSVTVPLHISCVAPVYGIK
jgi:hypothetical protein